jgi:hypothetical protein
MRALRREKWENQETPKRTLKRSRQKPLRKNAKRSRKRKNNNKNGDSYPPFLQDGKHEALF